MFMIILISLKSLSLVYRGKPIFKNSMLLAAVPVVYGLMLVDLADQTVLLYQNHLPTLMALAEYEKLRQLILARNNLLYYYKELLQTTVDNLRSNDPTRIFAGHEFKSSQTLLNLRQCKNSSVSSTSAFNLSNYPDLQDMQENTGLEGKNLHQSIKSIHSLESQMSYWASKTATIASNPAVRLAWITLKNSV